jgi:phosphoenolpyruvate phosphomutase
MTDTATVVRTDRAGRRCSPLRSMLQAEDLTFLMESHNGLSARIAQEAGFKALWASGLSISASLGVRDRNEAAWTQILEVVEFMADSVSVPILMDGDTGFGDFNNVRRLVRKLCQRNVAGICLEDKLFPKTNSFLGNEQELASIEEFCGKIRAAKDAQYDDEFCVVARIEALIAGRGMSEALKRGEAYHAAGADAILIHSKKKSADEVLEFTRHWGKRSPVIIVPTMYYNTPTNQFRKGGVSAVIWANHSLRASILAMQAVVGRIVIDQSVAEIDPDIAPLEEVFRLTDVAELELAEKLYTQSREMVASR